MDKYQVKISLQAQRDIDSIYTYIKNALLEPTIAINLVDEISSAITGLAVLPNRGTIWETGIYKNRQYRKLFVRNYTIIYKVIESTKQVIIITVQYSRRDI